MKKYTVITGKIAIALAVSIVFMSTTAVGDIALPNVQGETMQPVNVTNVQMVNETAYIDLCTENATVKCNFTLMNPGENESLLVGFPVGLGWEGHGKYLEAADVNDGGRVTSVDVLMILQAAGRGSGI
jgi:hypothetical protein